MTERTDILLINPPETSRKGDLTVLGLPLGILSIASILEKNGKKVKIFDALTNSDKLKVKDIGDGKVMIGSSFEEIKREIKKTNPKIVGVTNHFSSQIKNAIKVLEITKKINSKIITAIGGPHASCYPEELLKEKEIDYVIRGEGEIAFSKLVEKILAKKKIGKINNLAYREKGENKIYPIETIIELDELLFPAYHLINMEHYFKIISKGKGRIAIGGGNKKSISVITSRGCPFNCVFCSIHGHMGRRWRAHSSEYIVKHLKFLFDFYKIEHVSFEDDNLILDTKRFEEILDGIKKNKIKITWDTPNGVRADRLNFELLKKMKETGCTSIKIGIESGDQKVVDKIVGKNLRLEKVIEVAKDCKKLKIPLTGFFIIGFPGETKENIQNTLTFARRLKRKYQADSLITISMPLIGTRMYKISEERGYLVRGNNPSEFGGENNLVIETPEFSLDYLIEERRKFYKNMIYLQIIETLKNPLSSIKYFNLLKNPKKTLEILNYLTKNDAK